MTIHGYIFVSADGSYLTRLLLWYHYDRPEDAYVHSDNITHMMQQAKRAKWEIKPTHFIPAAWDGEKVIVTGEKQTIK
jgi:hypothetical protein